LGNAAIERIAGGCRFTEGPVWFGDGRYLLWSDIPNDRILKWEEETGAISVFRRPSNYANGNTRDRQGRLITCELEINGHGAVLPPPCGCCAQSITPTNMAMTSFTLVGNSADSRGLADVTPCIATPNDLAVQRRPLQARVRRAMGTFRRHR
jgi:hypothetical protein